MSDTHLVILSGDTEESLAKMSFSYALTTTGWSRMRIASALYEKTGEIKKMYYEDSRCVAISNDLDYLKSLAESNACDIHEGCYKYIVIEKVYHCLYPPCEKVLWYEWIPKEGGDKYEGFYQVCEEPEGCENIVGYALG